MNTTVGNKEGKKSASWKHLLIMVAATTVATVLAIYAVIAAPVAPFPGVSGLFLAAAVYVPLSLWFGVWGVLAGYFSCLILGFVSGFGLWSFYWALADLFEALIPLLAFRIASADVDIGNDLKRPMVVYTLLVVLLVNLIISAIATMLVLSILWLITFIIALILLIALYGINPTKSWLLYIVFGVVGASFISAIFGISGFIIAGVSTGESFWIGVIGWFAGDVIVLSAIATPMMVFLTGRLKETSVFVEKWFS